MCDHFANRLHNQHTTKVDSLIKHIQNADPNVSVGRPKVIAALRLFEKLKFGVYFKSKYGSRFEWGVQSKIICEQIAEGDEDWSFEVDNDDLETDGTATLIHSFHLRENFTVEVELPVDLTDMEAHRLSSFFGALSFSDD